MNPFDSAVDLATAVRTREISPVEILDIYLRRIDKHDPEINAFVWRDDETARAAARVAAQRVLDGTDLPPSTVSRSPSRIRRRWQGSPPPTVRVACRTRPGR
ncbi:hypothetical protein [Streptomyces rhizosphaericus]|uniref:hypothetical protein n=1 Tax=Streptomyces rhizosphaericus TaxID=114699 RepID=UPI0036283451